MLMFDKDNNLSLMSDSATVTFTYNIYLITTNVIKISITSLKTLMTHYVEESLKICIGVIQQTC